LASASNAVAVRIATLGNIGKMYVGSLPLSTENPVKTVSAVAQQNSIRRTRMEDDNRSPHHLRSAGKLAKRSTVQGKKPAANNGALTEKLKSYLRGLLPGCTVEIKLVEALETAETIMSVASDWQADLIVMSPHEHRGLDKFLIGSVSQEVARHSRCSIELIR
jgi:nucleotide-binding universal stress UspA family protein